MREQIKELREQGLTIQQISETLGCAKSTVSHHLKVLGMSVKINKIEQSKIEEIRDYYQTHSLSETALFFNIGKSTVKKYASKVREKDTEEERKAKAVKHVQNRRLKIKEMSVAYKGGCCQRCGYDKYIGALEFHHLDPNEKDLTISKGGHCSSWEKVKQELDKCILLCANCHREVHNELRNGDKSSLFLNKGV